MCLLSLWMHFKHTQVKTPVATVQLWTDFLLRPPQCGCCLTRLKPLEERHACLWQLLFWLAKARWEESNSLSWLINGGGMGWSLTSSNIQYVFCVLAHSPHCLIPIWRKHLLSCTHCYTEHQQHKFQLLLHNPSYTWRLGALLSTEWNHD